MKEIFFVSLQNGTFFWPAEKNPLLNPTKTLSEIIFSKIELLLNGRPETLPSKQ
jgi:hypothetical protein